jgi:hypothetical protein
MDFVAKVVTEQGAAFLVELVFVGVIQPTTPGGVVLLIFVALAATNVIIQVVKFLLRRLGKTDGQATENSTGDSRMNVD